MPGTKTKKFNPAQFMSATSLTHKTVQVQAGHVFYSQGDPAKSIYYLESGRAKLIVVSQRGKEATVSLMVAHDLSVKSRWREPLVFTPHLPSR